MVLSFPTTMNRRRLAAPKVVVGGQGGTVTRVPGPVAGTGGCHAKALQAGVFLGRGITSPGGGPSQKGAGRPGEARHTKADNSKLRAHGWKPEVSLDEWLNARRVFAMGRGCCE